MKVTNKRYIDFNNKYNKKDRYNDDCKHELLKQEGQVK